MLFSFTRGWSVCLTEQIYWDILFSILQVFCKKLGSAFSTKSFLILHENFGALVVKVSELVSYLLGSKTALWFEVEPSFRQEAVIFCIDIFTTNKPYAHKGKKLLILAVNT